MSLYKSRKARAAPEFLERVFTVPDPERTTLAKLEKQLGKDLDHFLTESKVAGEIPLGELANSFKDSSIPDEPRFVQDQVDYLMTQVIPYCVNTGSPKFIGHMTSAIPYFLQSLSKCMVALHQNVVKIETSRSFTFLERQTLAMMHRLIYDREDSFYDEHIHKRNSTLGIQCSGGTVANMMGLWIARNTWMEKVLGSEAAEEGLIEALIKSGKKNICIFVSQRGHYSLRKACDLLGMGKSQMRVIPVDVGHKINLELLKVEYQKALDENIQPIALIGVAGTTETGHFDPLNELADFAEEHQLHFHVDAAWGGGLLFSSKHRSVLKGCERSDTMVIDGHKQMYLPMGVGMLLTKDPELAKAIEHKAQYIIREGSFDLGRRHLEGSRPGMALLTHSALHILGRQGYELLINHNMDLAYRFSELIESHSEFELITKPETNILTYRYFPSAWKEKRTTDLDDKVSKLNLLLQKKQRESGKSFVSRTSFRHPEPKGTPITVLRSVLANPLTKPEHLSEILSEQVEIGESLLQQLL